MEKYYKYTLLSDSNAAGARAFGIAYKVGDHSYKNLQRFSIDLEARSGHYHHILPVTSVFILKEGKIVFESAKPDYRVPLNPENLLAAAAKSSR